MRLRKGTDAYREINSEVYYKMSSIIAVVINPDLGVRTINYFP